MNLTEWSKEVHALAVSKGWYESERSFGDVLMLITSELAEALEEHRNHQPPIYYYDPANLLSKPEGIAIEMADALIRILDYSASQGWDMERLVEIKHAYNKTRSHRHGGKKL